MINVVVISGPAGCGLSSAEFVFEELGYYVIKNAPSDTTEHILNTLIDRGGQNIAFVAHIRSLKKVIETCRKRKDINFRLIILNCSEEELFRRFYLTRHVHPREIIDKIPAEEAIRLDAQDTLSVINEADYVIDTTALTVKNLRARLYKYLEDVEEEKMTSITFISFGIKNGFPKGIDMFFDVRTIPNPYWVEELKELTGEDQKVIDYMNSFEVTHRTIKNIVDYLETYLEDLKALGRASYSIGIACSGGQHRSTYVANYLTDYFKNKYRTQAIHRDTRSLNK